MLAGMFASRASVAPPTVFSFNPADKNANVTLSNANMTASTNVDNGHYYAMCTLPKNSGAWIFEFVIDSMPPTDGRIAVGMADSPATGGTSSDTTAALGMNTGFEWYVRKSSALARFYYSQFVADTLTPATQSFDTGDRVTCTIDFSTNEAKVYRNGTLIHTKTVTSINTITYNYAPFIKLWGTVGTAATVSIPSGIAYPVAGFTPWA